MRDDEGEDLVDGKWWSKERCGENWRRRSWELKKRKWLLKRKCEFRTRWWVVRKFRIPVVVQDREHAFENWSQKRIHTRFAQGLHSCDFRTEILGRDREHAFWKFVTKENSHKGMCCVKISHKGHGWCEFWCVLAFLPCFPLFSFFKLSYLHVNTRTNSNHIRMNSRAKIKIKTCIYTRKHIHKKKH